MSSAPTQTPLPVPSFDRTNGDASPDSLLQWLQTLISQNLDGITRIPGDRRGDWTTLVNGLSDGFLKSLQTPEMTTWDTLSEKMVLVDATLEIIEQVTTRMEGVFLESEDLIKTFVQLLDLSTVLDQWIEIESANPTTPTAAALQAKALRVSIAILRSLGRGSSESPPWKLLRRVLLKSLDTIQDCRTRISTMAYPVVITIFDETRLHPATADDVFNSTALDLPNHLILDTPTKFSEVLGVILTVITGVIFPSTPCDLFLADIARRLLAELRDTFDFCMSAECTTTAKKRFKALLRIVESAKNFHSTHYTDPFISNVLHRLVLYRLKEGIKPSLTSLDMRLIELVKEYPMLPSSINNTRTFLDILRREQWVEDEHLQGLSLTYIRRGLPAGDPETLEEIYSTLQKVSVPAVEKLAADIKEVIGRNERGTGPLDRDQEKGLGFTAAQWRQRIRESVGRLIAPSAVEWMTDDRSFSDQDFAARSLQDVRASFEKPLTGTAESLESMNKIFTEYLCLVSKCDGKQNYHTSNLKIKLMPCAMEFASLLLDAPPEESPPVVRRAGYITLKQAILHQDSLTKYFSSVSTLVFRGLSDKDRTVRLNAGYALNALILQAIPREVSRSVQMDTTFTRLSQVFESSIPSIKETIIVVVGHMGRTTNTVILSHVLYFLTVQLGLHNPVLRSTAFTQMSDIIKYQQKSAYTVFAPHLERISLHLINRIQSQPSLLAEFCRLLSIGPSDFINITLRYTLPPLIARGQFNITNAITAQATSPRSEIYLQNSAKILAHIFMQDGDAPTKQGLDNLLKYLDNPSITSSSVIRSSMVGLLAELVIALGDESQEVAQAAISAMKKVQKCLGKAALQPLPQFLRVYIIGIIGAISEMLQDQKWKHTTTAKRKILRSIGSLVEQIGADISSVAPQIMATFQTMLSAPDTAEVTLESWYRFFTTIGPKELAPHAGPTTATLVLAWQNLPPPCHGIAQQILEYLIIDSGEHLGKYLDDIVDLSRIDELQHISVHLQSLRGERDPKVQLQILLDRLSSENQGIALQTLLELKSFMQTTHQDFVRDLASGDVFDQKISQVLAALLAVACRDGEGMEPLRLLAYECIGVLGAVDPDRCEVIVNDTQMVVLHNFTGDSESELFALHLVKDLLVKTFRATSDIRYQSFLSYSIQQLLNFCGLNASIVATGGSNGAIPLKVRSRWNSLPKHVVETVAPLLGGQFSLQRNSTASVTQHPVYSHHSTYREWIRLWTIHLIDHASGPVAEQLFSYVRPSVWSKDAAVAHHILPHLVLNILCSGDQASVDSIRIEITTVLTDQTDPESSSSYDKKQLSAQAVFMLLDHLNKWVRMIRQYIGNKKPESKRPRLAPLPEEEMLIRVDSVLSNIDQRLMAQAALQCRAYARALMATEQQIVMLREQSPQSNELTGYYERLHEIYANLDEPDGMEGVSTLVLSPSLEHQIRQHESTGRWTSAQSCWEVRLQQAPDNVELHLGLLRCLRNLGHYDTLRTHVRGVLTRHPEWQSALAEYQVESAWMVGAWGDVQQLVDTSTDPRPQIVIARVLLAMRMGDDDAISQKLSAARMVLGAPISAAGQAGYRRAYEAVLNLHLIHELEVIHTALTGIAKSQTTTQMQRREVMSKVTQTLASRLESTLPTFRAREPILSMRRAAFGLSPVSRPIVTSQIGRYWLASAKIARKAGQWQTAYSAVLQANQNELRHTFVESAKLIKSTGETLRALQDLENSMRHLGLIGDDVLDLTEDEQETKKVKAKSQVLRARWMNEADRYEKKIIYDIYKEATAVQPSWENGHYHLGQFHDECYKELPDIDKMRRGLRMNVFTTKSFAKAMKSGSKYVYQTVPRLLTIWLDLGEDAQLLAGPGNAEQFQKLNEVIARAIQETPIWKWYTAFPQIVSRVGHSNPDVYQHLSKLIGAVLFEYPQQALWLFASVVKSTKANRGQRGKQILDQLRSNPKHARTTIPKLVNESLAMTNELLALCNFAISDDKNPVRMSKDFPKLANLGHSKLLIPLQESMIANLPPTSATESTHQPFPIDAPTFDGFAEEIEVMRSLAKPRKITIKGSNGQIYMFLGKPKDDLRKDARLMDFNAIVNKLLKANSESRRRQLHIRTYAVVTLNEECGFIQWVPNTIPMRPVLMKGYDARRIKHYPGEVSETLRKIKESNLKDPGVAQLFEEKILPHFPPVFHEWFLETFPEPTAWLASRLTYSRTAAVMSMVGFIIGLGDRHGENILLDTNSGDVVHVDFNCLFEKGKALETPERVPFRLTQNIVDGFGVTGVEGVFRISCEVTLQLLRDNKDSLMNVLDAFVHDPLVEWEDEKRRMERRSERLGEPSRRNPSKATVDLQNLAKGALKPIEKKLKGIYTTSKERPEKEVSTSNLVQMLIQEATDSVNLARMYPGWASWI